jgi:2Fe-2S ferredoxin
LPKITYILADGTRREVTAAPGATVMSAAIQNRIKGILADCGGSCSCATCHVYLEPGFEALFPPVSELESEMLEGVVSERLDNSRLSCQLTITEEAEGLVVRLPERQA